MRKRVVTDIFTVGDPYWSLLTCIHNVPVAFPVRQVTSVLPRLKGLLNETHQLKFRSTVFTFQEVIISELIQLQRFIWS